MAKRRELQLVRSSGAVLRFDSEGSFIPSLELVHAEGADPTDPVEVRVVWEFRGCRFASSDNTATATWAKVSELLDAVQSRADPIRAARIVRDPSGDAATVLSLSQSTYEQFRLEEVTGGPDPNAPNASWDRTATFDLRLSAVNRFADADGIVSLTQEKDESYPEGSLRELEWITRITTREGVDAAAKVRTFGSLYVASPGSDHTYLTGNSSAANGVDVKTLDEDNRTATGGSSERLVARVPTVAIGTSRVRQWAINVGVTGPGSSPSIVSKSVTTKEETVDGRRQEVTTTQLFAKGPNAQAWVESQAPVVYEDRELVDGEADETYGATYVSREDPQTDDGTTIRVVITGGHEAQRWRPLAGGLEPFVAYGGIRQWTATVTVLVKKVGGGGTRAELKVPGRLPKPWILDENGSQEGEPEIDHRAGDPARHVWKREATYVYNSPKRPEASPLVQLGAAQPVNGLLLTV